MKTLSLLCLGWLLLAASGARAQVPSARQPAELMNRRYAETSFGKLDGHGNPVFQELYQDDYPAEWHDTWVYYPHRSRQASSCSTTSGP